MVDDKKTNEELFIAWLGKKVRSSCLSELYLCYPEIEQFCIKNKILCEPLFATTDLKTVKKVQRTISENRLFSISHKKQMKTMISAAQYYTSYIYEYNSKLTETVETKVFDIASFTTDERVSFDSLLKDSRFDSLREALLHNGLYTINDLKQINLWVFMNSNRLYSIHDRLTICTELTAALNAFDRADSDIEKYVIFYNGSVYSGDTPSKAFVTFLTDIAAKYPLKFRSLIGAIHPQTANIVVYRYDYDGSKLKLINPEAFIDKDLSLNNAKLYVAWVLERCAATPPDFTMDKVTQVDALSKNALQSDSFLSENQVEETIYRPLEENVKDEIPPKREGNISIDNMQNDFTAKDETNDTLKTSPNLPSPLTQKAEDYLLKCDLAGATYDQLQQVLMHTMVGTKEVVALSPHIIEMNRRLYHIDVFVDFEEGTEKIDNILDKLLKKNNGIATSGQLYEFACSELSMFMNDNGITQQQAIFDFARYLFEKQEYHSKHYFFHSNTYISLPEISVDSHNGIIQKYAREKGTIVTYKEIDSYLSNIGLNNGNLRGIMRIDKEPIFLIYRENEYLLAELINMDETFFNRIHAALKHLFDDVGDHVILRSISDSWYNLLPALPDSLNWTPMLLQQLLHYFSNRLGARTILPMISQGSNTLHAMLVENDSLIQDFRDAVAVYLHDEKLNQTTYKAEELRKILVESGMISGNQLIYNMHIALGGDPRFLWNSDENNVSVRL